VMEIWNRNLPDWILWFSRQAPRFNGRELRRGELGCGGLPPDVRKGCAFPKRVA
jgi:hypothetical protein